MPAPSALASISLEPSPTIDAYKGGIDRTLLRENLRLTPAERVEKMIAALRFAEAVRRLEATTSGPCARDPAPDRRAHHRSGGSSTTAC